MKKLLAAILLFSTISIFADEPKEIVGERKAKENALTYTGIFNFEGHMEGKPGVYFCSMFAVLHENKQRVLTAGHCCNGTSPVLTIVKKDPNYDICEIKPNMELPFKGGIELSNKEMKLLDTVYTAGVLAEQGLYFGKGYIRMINKIGVYSTSYMRPGMSGGPTFDEDGNLYGINSLYQKDNFNAIFVPVYIIKDFLK